MSGAKHTPGPWQVIEDGIREFASDGILARIDDGGRLDGEAIFDDRTCEANAHLIAAAPDLLEALKGYMAAVEQMNAAMKDGRNVHGALAGLVGAEGMANAAIAKAEGRS